MVLPEIELIRIAPENCGCTVIGQKACVWKDNGNYKATSWDAMGGEWSFETLIYHMGETGYTARYIAIFVGEDKDGLRCYVIYDPDY